VRKMIEKIFILSMNLILLLSVPGWIIAAVFDIEFLSKIMCCAFWISLFFLSMVAFTELKEEGFFE